MKAIHFCLTIQNNQITKGNIQYIPQLQRASVTDAGLQLL